MVGFVSSQVFQEYRDEVTAEIKKLHVEIDQLKSSQKIGIFDDTLPLYLVRYQEHTVKQAVILILDHLHLKLRRIEEVPEHSILVADQPHEQKTHQ